MAKFKLHQVVEQKNLGDLPFMVIEIITGSTPKYTLSGIDGSEYSNIPEYMLVSARPPEQSQYGLKGKNADQS